MRAAGAFSRGVPYAANKPPSILPVAAAARYAAKHCRQNDKKQSKTKDLPGPAGLHAEPIGEGRKEVDEKPAEAADDPGPHQSVRGHGALPVFALYSPGQRLYL